MIRFLWLLAAAPAFAQVLSISAPQPAVVVGAKMTLMPLVRDPAGNLINANDWVWTSLDTGTLSIDQQGVVTGVKIGIAEVRVTAPKESGTLFGSLKIPVHPASVSISPSLTAIDVGAAVQFSAAAYDVNGKAIPSASFTWDVTAEDGRPNLVPSTTSVSSTGKFTSKDAGRYAVHAVVNVLPVYQALPSHFEAVADVDVVVPPSFQMDVLLSSDPVDTKKLLPAPGVFTANESGTLAFTASLDGVSTAAVIYEAGKTQAVVTTGGPSPQPGGVIAGFQSLALNANGEALIAIKAGDRANGALLARSPSSSQYVLLDNAAGTDINGSPEHFLTYLSLTPYSLNDNRTALIKALHLPQDGAPGDERDGLFLLRNALSPQLTPELLWSADKGLPGVPATGTPARIQFILDNTEGVAGWAGLKGLGIDNRETVYFMAQSAQGRGLFQVTSGSTPQKILVVGDTYLTSKVKDIQDLVVTGAGDVALRVTTSDSVPHVALFRNGARFADLPVFANPRVLAASAAGVLFEGVPSSGKPEGLYLWDFKTATSVLSLSTSVTYISTASINSKGKILAVVRSGANDFIVAQPGGANLLSAGADANLSAPLDLKSLVKGNRDGLPSLTVADPASLFDMDDSGHAIARVVLGQSLPGGGIFSGASGMGEDASGAQYFVSANNLYKNAAGAVTLLTAAGAKAADGTVITPRAVLGVNSAGVVLLDAATNAADQHRGIYQVKGTAITQVTRTKTAFAGRQISDFGEGAIDDNSNSALVLLLDDGTRELVHFAGGTARSIANTRSAFNGQNVAAFDRLRGLGGAFYVRFALSADFVNAALVRFTASSTQSLVASGDRLPDGTQMGDLRLTDYNRNGDVIFTSTVLSTGTQVLGMRPAAGGLVIVAANNRVLQTGDYLVRFSDTHIRDNGVIYFMGLDVNDRTLIVRARPVATGAPFVLSGGVVSAADFRSDTLTPGSWFSIYGTNLGSTAQWNGDPNTFSLGGATVTVCGTPVTLSFNSGSQINAFLPESLASRTSCPVVVSVNGQPAPGTNVAIAASSLLLFQFTAQSSGLLPVITHIDYSVVGAVEDGLQPAKTGEVLLAWGTGNCNNPSATLGGVPARVAFAGRVAQGLCQINFVVPDGVSGAQSLTFSSSPHRYTLRVR